MFKEIKETMNQYLCAINNNISAVIDTRKFLDLKPNDILLINGLRMMYFEKIPHYQISGQRNILNQVEYLLVNIAKEGEEYHFAVDSTGKAVFSRIVMKESRWDYRVQRELKVRTISLESCASLFDRKSHVTIAGIKKQHQVLSKLPMSSLYNRFFDYCSIWLQARIENANNSGAVKKLIVLADIIYEPPTIGWLGLDCLTDIHPRYENSEAGVFFVLVYLRLRRNQKNIKDNDWKGVYAEVIDTQYR